MFLFNLFKKTPLYERFIITSEVNDIFTDFEKLKILEQSISDCNIKNEAKGQFELRIYNETISEVIENNTKPILSKKLQWGKKKRPSLIVSEILKNFTIKYLGLEFTSKNKSTYPNIYLVITFHQDEVSTVHLAIKKDLMEKPEFMALQNNLIKITDPTEIYKTESRWKNKTLYKYIDSFSIRIIDRKVYFKLMDPKDNWQPYLQNMTGKH